MEEVGGGVFCEVFGTGVKTYFDFVFIGYPMVYGRFSLLLFSLKLSNSPNRIKAEVTIIFLAVLNQWLIPFKILAIQYI